MMVNLSNINQAVPSNGGNVDETITTYVGVEVSNNKSKKDF